MIKVLRTLMGKIDNKKGHREMELYKKIKRKCWISKNNVTEMKNAFNRLPSRLKRTMEKITVNFSETMEGRRYFSAIFEVLTEKIY